MRKTNRLLNPLCVRWYKVLTAEKYKQILLSFRRQRLQQARAFAVGPRSGASAASPQRGSPFGGIPYDH